MIDALNPTPDEQTPAPAAPAVDVLAALAAVTAELASMKAAAAQAQDAAIAAQAAQAATAEAEALAKLTDTQRTQAELETLKAKLATQEAAQTEQTRSALLDSLGVDPSYRLVFPAGDARDPKVKASIEKFAADHPRLLTRPPGPTQPQVPDLQSKLQGRQPNPLVDMNNVRASYAAAEAALGR